MSSVADVVYRAVKKDQNERCDHAGDMHAHLTVIVRMLLERFSALI